MAHSAFPFTNYMHTVYVHVANVRDMRIAQAAMRLATDGIQSIVVVE